MVGPTRNSVRIDVPHVVILNVGIYDHGRLTLWKGLSPKSIEAFVYVVNLVSVCFKVYFFRRVNWTDIRK